MAAPEADASDEAANATGERAVARACVRGSTLATYREVTREVCGEEGLAAVAALLREGPLADGMADVLTEASEGELPEWAPASWALAWCDALWFGPLSGDAAALRRWTERLVDRGFAARQGLLLSIATPSGVLRRMPDLFRAELSHGRVVAYAVGPNEGVLTVHDHAFTEHPVMRDVIALSLRRVLERAGALECVTEHDRAPAPTLEIRVRWR